MNILKTVTKLSQYYVTATSINNKYMDATEWLNSVPPLRLSPLYNRRGMQKPGSPPLSNVRSQTATWFGCTAQSADINEQIYARVSLYSQPSIHLRRSLYKDSEGCHRCVWKNTTSSRQQRPNKHKLCSSTLVQYWSIVRRRLASIKPTLSFCWIWSASLLWTLFNRWVETN